MEIKCNINPYSNSYYNYPRVTDGRAFDGHIPLGAEKVADIVLKKPVAEKNAAGFSGLISRIKNYAKNYVKNVKHTYDHKIVFALIEKELFGKNSIDSITHDLDKMILYLLGFPKSFVTDFHRKHSVHHPESRKKPNLRSMLCDNIASSPEFKPEKKLSLREHYKQSKQLKKVIGLKGILEKYNYGEDLDFNKIKTAKNNKFKGVKGFARGMVKSLACLI